MSNRHDLRRQDRRVCDHSVAVIWRDPTGNEKFFNAKAVDISEAGLRLQMPEALPKQAYVTIRAFKLGLQGNASVRHCSRLHGSKYVVGIEFTAGLRWTSKD
jgi:hypothetical protein